MHETNILGAVWLERLGGRKKDERSDLSHYIRLRADAEVYLAETSEAPTRCLFAAARHTDAALSETAVGLLLVGASVAKSGGVRRRKEETTHLGRLVTQVAFQERLA